MEIVIKIVQFFLSFTLLVGIHEFGHFIAARIFGMRVDKFYILFNPWFSLFKFKRGDTEYGVGWLPLGGYCKIAGMIDESLDTDQLSQPAQPYEFRSKPAWQRLIVMVAGVVMNIILAIVIYIGVSFVWGESYLSTESAKWGYDFNQTGEEMGFVGGDKILSIDGERMDDISMIVNRIVLSDGDREVVVDRGGEEVALTLKLEDIIEMRKHKAHIDLLTLRMPFVIDSVVADGASEFVSGDEIVAIDGESLSGYSAYRSVFEARRGESVSLSVLRGADTLSLLVPVSEEGLIGVMARNPYKFENRSYNIIEAIPAGFRRAGASISSYWNQLSLIFQPKTEMYRELGGFVSIGNMFSGVWDWEDFWLKTAFLSIILSVMNILPIPGLDGGHSVITIYEMITGRKPNDNFLIVTQYIGLAFILVLMLYANGNDFYRLLFR